MINIAIIGFGGICKAVHFPAYVKLEESGQAKIVAICDIRPERFTDGEEEINIGSSNCSINSEIHIYTDWHEMINNEKVDMVDICVPTYLHANIAVEVLKSGFNVLCEKPMSLSYELCKTMLVASRESGKKLMIGQCLRFSYEYNYLKKLVENNTYGKVLGASFHRLSPPPIWGWENWYMDYEKSHGAITDLHIHDIDMIRYLFGEPNSVSCTTKDVYSKKDSAFSTLRYDDFTVHAVGDWSLEGISFSADYSVCFEKATVVYSGGVITVYPRNGEAFIVPKQEQSMYQNEIEFFANCIATGKENTINSPESAAKTIKLIEALIQSSDKNGDFIIFSTNE